MNSQKQEQPQVQQQEQLDVQSDVQVQITPELVCVYERKQGNKHIQILFASRKSDVNTALIKFNHDINVLLNLASLRYKLLYKIYCDNSAKLMYALSGRKSCGTINCEINNFDENYIKNIAKKYYVELYKIEN